MILSKLNKQKSITLKKAKVLGTKVSSVVYFSAITLIIFIALLIIRSKTLPDFYDHPFIFIYSVSLVAFLLSRLFAALFYQKSYSVLVDTEEAKEYEPSITFVIPCKNEEDAIEHTVMSCLEADYPKEKCEVIVINDGSTDSTGEILERIKKDNPERLTIISWKKNRGKREGMAAGFRLAKGDIVIQLDSDSYIRPDTVRELIKPFIHPEVAAVCGHADVANASENYITKMQSAYYNVSFRVMKAAESTFYMVFCCSGCSSAYRKEPVLLVLEDWLNEKFLGTKVTYGDDRSLTTWMLREGYKTIYSDRVQAYTIAPNNIKQFFKQQLRWKKSWIINGLFTLKFLFKNDISTALFYFLPLITFSFLSPIVGLLNVYFYPIFFGFSNAYYLFGVLLMAALFIIYSKSVTKNDKYWPYLFLWQIIGSLFMSYIIFYAVFKIKDRGWGTR